MGTWEKRKGEKGAFGCSRNETGIVSEHDQLRCQ